jgi:hypothetical protein
MTKGIKILDVLPLSKHSYLSDINDRLSKDIDPSYFENKGE